MLFIELALKHSGQFAVLADSRESRIAQEYVVMLARLRGVNVRTFRDEAAAAQWLNGNREPAEGTMLEKEGLARPNY